MTPSEGTMMKRTLLNNGVFNRVGARLIVKRRVFYFRFHFTDHGRHRDYKEISPILLFCYNSNCPKQGVYLAKLFGLT